MKELTSQQENLIILILTSKSIKEACEKGNVSRVTYYNWLKDEEFRQRLREEMDITFFEARQTLKNASIKACDVLIDLLNSENINIRRLVAVEMLNLAFKNKDEEMEERLEKIEKLVLERRIQK